jgi:hypothetical protein
LITIVSNFFEDINKATHSNIALASLLMKMPEYILHIGALSEQEYLDTIEKAKDITSDTQLQALLIEVLTKMRSTGKSYS